MNDFTPEEEAQALESLLRTEMLARRGVAEAAAESSAVASEDLRRLARASEAETEALRKSLREARERATQAEGRAKAEGAAARAMQLNFDDVSGSPCRAGRISMIGTYFYDALTNDAGVYALHATPHRTGRAPAAGRAGRC